MTTHIPSGFWGWDMKTGTCQKMTGACLYLFVFFCIIVVKMLHIINKLFIFVA